jgi:predicted oxidoreductase
MTQPHYTNLACQKCGGEIQGWTCQGCGQVFRENDAGALVFDAMEAVAWRESARQRVAEIVEAAIERHAPTNSLRHTLDDADDILQALAVIPTYGGGND